MIDKSWFFEEHKKTLRVGFKVKKVLFDQKSQFQSVKIVETEAYGNMLINDDIVMTCERDEFIYHEMISHVPLFTHPHPQNVLIIGGGDGGTAREVLKHPSLKKCVMVEIDSLVVEACRKHLKVTSQSLDHPLLDLKIEDGAAYVSGQKNFFDVIIVDSSDPIGPAEILFGKEFYKNVFEALKPDGLVVAQGESFLYEMDVQRRLLHNVKDLFDKVGFYNYGNLTYPGSNWSFLFASKKYHPLQDFKETRIKESKIDFRYYNAGIHKCSFSHPQFVKKEFSSLMSL